MAVAARSVTRGPRSTPFKHCHHDILTSATCVLLLWMALLSNFGTLECSSRNVMVDRAELADVDRGRVFSGMSKEVDSSPAL